MKFSALVAEVSGILSDVDNLAWSVADIQAYLAEAERVIISFRPDASAITATVGLVAGPRQRIPGDGVQLLDVVRNIGGRSVRRVSRTDKDATTPRWMVAAPSAEVREYVFEDVLPKEYLVSPPSNTGVQVEIVYSRNSPAPDFSTDPDVFLDAIYASPMVDFALSRALSRADYGSAEFQKAQTFWSLFLAKVGGKTQGDAGVQSRGKK